MSSDWPALEPASASALLAACPTGANPDNPEFRDGWERWVRPVWEMAPEVLLERYLLLKRLLDRLSGNDGSLYRADAERKRLELSARLGKDVAAEMPPHDASFLRWVSWWERGRAGPAPQLADSPFSSFCQTLEWGEPGRLEFLRKTRARSEPRFLLLRTLAAEESCRQLADKERWVQLGEVARQHELTFYTLLARQRLEPSEETAARWRYRAYRVERLRKQSAGLGLPELARWIREGTDLIGVR